MNKNQNIKRCINFIQLLSSNKRYLSAWLEDRWLTNKRTFCTITRSFSDSADKKWDKRKNICHQISIKMITISNMVLDDQSGRKKEETEIVITIAIQFYLLFFHKAKSEARRKSIWKESHKSLSWCYNHKTFLLLLLIIIEHQPIWEMKKLISSIICQ